MKPVDFQPPIFQTPNVERIQQEQVSRPQVSQQVIAAETQKIGSERPGQVQASEARSGPPAAETLSEDRGERSLKRMRRGKRPEAKAEDSGKPSLEQGLSHGSELDIRV